MTIKKGMYQHYKGHTYEVLFTAKHSETLEELVIYRRWKTDDTWARPAKMFEEEVEVDGQKVPRFKFLHSWTEDQ